MKCYFDCIKLQWGGKYFNLFSIIKLACTCVFVMFINTMICYGYCLRWFVTTIVVMEIWGGLWRILFGSPRGKPLLLILVVGTLSGPFSIPYPWSGFGNRRLGKTPLEPRPKWEVREGTDTWSEWYNLSGVIQHEWFRSTSQSYTEEIGWGGRKSV